MLSASFAQAEAFIEEMIKMAKFYQRESKLYLATANARLASEGWALVESARPCHNGVTFDLHLRQNPQRGDGVDFPVFLESPRRELKELVAKVEEEGLVAVLGVGYPSEALWDAARRVAGVDAGEERPFLLRDLVMKTNPEVWVAAEVAFRPAYRKWAAQYHAPVPESWDSPGSQTGQ
jgi:hypothetical protein